MALNDEASTRRWLPSHVYPTLADARAAIDFLIACYSTPGDPSAGPYVLAVDESGTGLLLGHVGFSPLGREVEVSYAIAESARGRGYGAEALVRACDWVARAFGLQDLVAITAVANVASRVTLERASFVHVHDTSMDVQGTERAVSRYARRSRDA
jgi:RimJ/RimL family protein N-acetyltransferase